MSYLSTHSVPRADLITEVQRDIILLLPHFKYEKTGWIGVSKNEKLKS